MTPLFQPMKIEENAELARIKREIDIKRREIERALERKGDAVKGLAMAALKEIAGGTDH